MPFEQTRDRPLARTALRAAVRTGRETAGAIAAVGRGIDAVVADLQHTRMMSLLHQLSDHRLAELGISRDDIPDYARRQVENR